MLSMNRATLVGHAGGDPEIRKLASGEDVARFSLATTERFTRRDDTAGQSTEWHSIVAFGAAAEAVRTRVRKGDPVLVEGRIATRSWKDRAGIQRRSTEIVVAGPRGQINVLSRRSRNGSGDDEPPGGAAAGAAGSPAEETADATASQSAGSQDGDRGGEPEGAAGQEDRSAGASPEGDGAGADPGDGTAAGADAAAGVEASKIDGDRGGAADAATASAAGDSTATGSDGDD